MAMAKLALAGLFCFLAGAAWVAIVFTQASVTAGPGIGVIVGVPRAARFLCVAGFALLLCSGLFALVRTIRRRFSA